MTSDRPRFAVKHFLACGRVHVPTAGPSRPYNLWNVGYEQTVPADREWPVRLDELWLYARFYNGTGRRSFTISVSWFDPPAGRDPDVAYFPVGATFPVGVPVLSWSWNVSNVRYPGPGVYVFRLIDDRKDRLLADEYIHIQQGES